MKHATLTNPKTRSADQDPRWAAIAGRDASADGRFVYSVQSTGVYCKPSCAARLPNPRNVAFHDSPAAAEAAGFRACKRCRPDQAAPAHAAMIADICRLLESAETPPSLAALSARAGLSPHHFHRVFKAALGVTPLDYFQSHRARRVRDGLRRGANVTETIYDSGYQSSSRFYEKTGGMLGMTPGQFRDGGKGAIIKFAIGQSSLGAILVASTEKGVCAILLGDDAAELLRDLQRRFPKANLVGGDAAYEKLAAQVIGFVEAPQRDLSLPLDIRGTAFQQRVWKALRAIPAGRTASYAEIAAAIGAPKAMRAVAGACAANPLAVAVPCHRVVRNDGALSGYRWGVERKRALLEREAKAKAKR